MKQYTLVNPVIKVNSKKKFNTTIKAYSSSEAAEKFWNAFSKYVTHNVATFGFTLQSGGSNKFHHYIVSESLNNDAEVNSDSSEARDAVNYKITKLNKVKSSKNDPSTTKEQFANFVKNHKDTLHGGDGDDKKDDQFLASLKKNRVKYYPGPFDYLFYYPYIYDIYAYTYPFSSFYMPTVEYLYPSSAFLYPYEYYYTVPSLLGYPFTSISPFILI